MRRLHPPTAPPADPSAEPLDTLQGLADAYAYPDTGARPWLRANMIASLDGAAHHQGHSGALSAPPDVRLLGVLRALADVVLVGAGTARAEGYGPMPARPSFAERRKAAGQRPAAAFAVVSASLRLDVTAPIFTEAPNPTLVVTTAAAPSEALRRVRAAAEVIIAGDGHAIDPVVAVRELAARGHTRLLCEGGPRLLGAVAASGALDELCLTIAPTLALGEAGRITAGSPVDELRAFRLDSLLEQDGYLFSRYRANSSRYRAPGAPTGHDGADDRSHEGEIHR